LFAYIWLEADVFKPGAFLEPHDRKISDLTIIKFPKQSFLGGINKHGGIILFILDGSAPM
jgi:hypothetical protein